jgi:hypothetical protein
MHGVRQLNASFHLLEGIDVRKRRVAPLHAPDRR